MIDFEREKTVCFDRIKDMKINQQYSCTDTRDFLRRSTKPTSARLLSPYANDSIISQLDYKLILYETRVPFSPTPSSPNPLTVKHKMKSPYSPNM